MVTVRPAQRWTIRHLWIEGDLAIGLYIIGLYPSGHPAVTDFDLIAGATTRTPRPQAPRGCNARPDDALKYEPEDIAIPETLVTRPREHRVIRNFVLDAKPAEPAIGKVDLDFAAQRSL